MGVNVPVHVTPLLAEVIVASAPLGQLTSAELANAATASEKVSVSVGVSPVFIAVSSKENTETVGWVLSTVTAPVSAVVSAAAPGLPAASSKVQEKVTAPLVSPSATSMDATQPVPDPLYVTVFAMLAFPDWKVQTGCWIDSEPVIVSETESPSFASPVPSVASTMLDRVGAVSS